MLVQAAPAIYSARVQDSKRPTSIKDNFDNLADAVSKLCRQRNRSNEPCEAPKLTQERERLYDNIAGVMIKVIDFLRPKPVAQTSGDFLRRKPVASVPNPQLFFPHLQNAAATPAPMPPVGSLFRALADFLRDTRSLIKRPGGAGNLAEQE